MKCPKGECGCSLVWSNDFDIEEGDITDKDGEPFIIQSFWDCPECMTQVCVFY